MSPENFAYWLQGFLEMTDAKEITPQQIQMIKQHLGLVLNQVTVNTPLFYPPVTYSTSDAVRICSSLQTHATC